MSNSDLTSKYEAERLRAAEQSQIVYLQGQIDELRRQLKDQTNKYNWAMEQVRKLESAVSQVEGVFDRHRQETAQAIEGHRRDIVAVRKEVAGALVKIEESLKPIREMQIQIHQLGEARKQDRDQTATWVVRIDELDERIRTWNAQLRDIDDRYRGLGGKLDALTTVDEGLRGDMRKLAEELQIERQSLRRQAVEAQQLVADVRGQISEQHSRLTRLDEIRQHIEVFSEQIPGQIVALDGRIAATVEEAKRIERLSTERFLMNQERLEDLRRQQDEKVIALQETDDQYQRQFSSWLERIDGLVRELEQRLARATARIEEAQREHTIVLNTLERRDMQLADTLVTTLREYAEQLRAEQIELGRTEEERSS